jgi:mRNA interferase MazF
MTRNLRRGDVVYVGFPTTDATEVRRRPALIVQDAMLNTAFPNVIVVGITSKIANRGPGRIFVRVQSPEGREMGLLKDSLVTVDNLATVGRWMIIEVRGTCPIMAEVDEALRTILGLHRP